MLPSPLTILGAVVVAFFVVLTIVRGPVDADYWWHLTTGRMILETGSVPGLDPYSFAYDGPWVAHEWLGEVVIAACVGALGFPLTAGLFGAGAAGAILVPAFAVHRQGVRTAAVLPFVAIATYGIASFSTVRPQVLSWLLMGALLALLIALRPEQRVRPWVVAPLFLVWANIHGLYVIGLAVLGVYAAASLLGRTPMAVRGWQAAAMFVTAVAASVLTPAGPAGLLYPLRYLRQDDWGTAFIAEWQAIDLADPRQWGVVVMMLAAVVLVRHLRRDWLTVVGLAGLAGAVIAVRNGPIAVVAAIPMLGLAFQAWLDIHVPHRASSPRDSQLRRSLELAAGALVIAATVAILPRVASGSEAGSFPRAAFQLLAARNADARLLVDYDWAGYAIHRVAASGGSVFIDGRSDMYPRAVFEDYLALRNGEEGWEDLVRQYRVEAILLPPSAPLTFDALRAGWCESYVDGRAVLLLRCPDAVPAGRHRAPMFSGTARDARLV